MALRHSLLFTCLLLASCTASLKQETPENGLTYLPLTVFAVDEAGDLQRQLLGFDS